MAAVSLVRDKESNLKETGLRNIGKYMEYEFAFPYQNEDAGDSFWQVGKAYQIAILVGQSEEFNGLTEDVWMSDQVYIRVGSPSQESIYHPPYAIRGEPMDRHQHFPRGSNGQKIKTK